MPPLYRMAFPLSSRERRAPIQRGPVRGMGSGSGGEVCSISQNTVRR